MRMKFTKGLLAGSIAGAYVAMRMNRQRNNNDQLNTGTKTDTVNTASKIIIDDLRR
ncbi:MAG: hypothetical protein ACOZCL_01340 [Bacillota bacterium]